MWFWCSILHFHSFSCYSYNHFYNFLDCFLINVLVHLNDLPSFYICLSYCDFPFPIDLCLFSTQRRSYNISFRVGLILLDSFSFCFTEKFFLSPSILNDNLTVQSILVPGFSLSGLWICHAIPFWPAQFLKSNQLLSLWSSLLTSSFSFFFFLFLFFVFYLFRATPTAYGGSQARGLIGAVAADLHQSHSNTGSELHLQPAPQLMAMLDP